MHANPTLTGRDKIIAQAKRFEDHAWSRAMEAHAAGKRERAARWTWRALQWVDHITALKMIWS